jgi:polyphosphate kinase
MTVDEATTAGDVNDVEGAAGTDVAAHPLTELELAPLPEDRFADRELSWLRFNERVLELAEDERVPLLERVRFLAIFASNLDEFFMVRVAGLKRRIAAGMAVTAASGYTPRQVMERISTRAHELTRCRPRASRSSTSTRSPTPRRSGCTSTSGG